MKTKAFILFLSILLLLSSCGVNSENSSSDISVDNVNTSSKEDVSVSSDVDVSGIYNGYFEDKENDVIIECISGTENAYTLSESTLTFSNISEESVYSISGNFTGNIVIVVGEENKFTLELHGFSLVSNDAVPIYIESCSKATIKAKKDTKNYIYDMRDELDSNDEAQITSAIYSSSDLEIGGKGELSVVSENNCGIKTKDDLEVKNLTLFVSCADNSLKGNDGVELNNATTTLIAAKGDCIKTENNHISDKGNQKGDVKINGGIHTLYAACDGIDSAHDTVVDGEATVLNIYTDKYSGYSKEVTATSSSEYYIRFTSNQYSYSVKYYNNENDFLWVDATYHSSVSGGRTTYYYYSLPKKENYAKMQFFIYSSDMTQGSEDEYLVCSDYLERNTSYDTLALTSRGNRLSYSWTNYTTNIQAGGFGGGPGGPGGPGGFGEGNSDKSSYSTKGIKAANTITIDGGTIYIKSYDDSLHAGDSQSLGNITINKGDITLYSNDDGIHADGTLTINGGSIDVINSYEGLEGTTVLISGGNVSINAKDDGVNSTSTTGESITISGGTVYIYCTGDGIDSNSRSDYNGIVFSGGNTVIISNSGMNSAIDSERGYKYIGGNVVAIMPRGGMSNEAIHCENFSSIGSYTQKSLKENEYLKVDIKETTVYIKMPASLSALIVVLGDSSPKTETVSSVSEQLDKNGVCWNYYI